MARPRLIERLNEGLRAGRTHSVTLIAAPAGFGKTTLLSEWLAQKDEGRTTKDDPEGSVHPSREAFSLQPVKVAWLSLDENDNDLSRFLTYVVAALQTIDASLGAEALDLLHAAQRQPLPAELILTTLINDLAGLPDEVVLVLDDYHLIEIQPIHEALTFLLDHLPRQLHLAIASRADPPLPLARRRARGELTELRAADLRFAPDEAARFLNQVMGLGLAAEDIAALETRTEGWIAGLQMAALSMQGREDIAGFVRAFTGSHRYIIDYLVEEVLLRQPDPVRSFLLHSAILDQLCGPLCEAVTGQTGGRGLLHGLERANLFVVPLDDQREWYRYHHLFADVLRARMREAQPELVPLLHRRASEWYAQHAQPVEAVQHALAAEDFERAAGLVELAWPALGRQRQDVTLRGWLKALPDEVVRRRPVLSVYFASALLMGGELEAVESRLRDAERWLDTPAGQRVVANEDEFSKLAVTIAINRAGLAQAQGDIAGATHHAQRALAGVQPGDHLGRSGAAGFLGLALWANGDLAAAQQTFGEAVASMHLSGNYADAISGAIALAEMQTARGGLREARRILEQAGQLAATQREPALTGSADLLVALSELDCEHNELEAAEAHLQRSQALGERAALPENRYRWPAAMARLRAAQGDPAGALDLLGEAERLHLRGLYPDVRPIAALTARIWIAQGRLAEAQRWAQSRGLADGLPDVLSYLREFEHLTLARLLIARYRADREESTRREALGLLERLLRAAELGGRNGSVIEILVLQALAHPAHDAVTAALVPLERALTLAAPEGYVRTFVDEGPPIAALLGRVKAEDSRMAAFVQSLLAAWPGPNSVLPSAGTRSVHPLLEPLSQRELEVLRLLKTELSGPEIAQALMIGLSTVRTYTKNIYGKLSVNSRQAAVKRAAELDLI